MKRFSIPSSCDAYTLIELIAAIAIVAILTLVALPAINSLASGNDMVVAAASVSGAIEEARNYAMSHNTYTWLGFFEENGAQPPSFPAKAGTGRLVLSLVASADGTKIYDAASSPPINLDPTRLVQVDPLLRIQNVHLKSFSGGTGSGITFATRPALSSPDARVGDAPAVSGAFPSFQFPVGTTAPAQYTFSKVLQFSPRGEVLSANMLGVTTPLVEVGLQPANGSSAVPTNSNLIALQVAGISGNVRMYRP